VALADPRRRHGLPGLGVIALPGSPTNFAKLVADLRKWGKVVRAANIKPD